MVRTIVVAALSWLIAATGFAQDTPHDKRQDLPLSVETLALEPTVVKTGDLTTGTYRVRFKDLVAESKEVVVLEDRMAPGKLPVSPFNAVALEVKKRQVGDEHIWDFVYRFRIINPTKSTYTVPSFGFYWLVRDLGQKIEEAKVLVYETDALPVRYVTTIMEGTPLDVRDTIELGDFSRQAAMFRTIAWVVAPLPLVLWVVLLVGVLRRTKPVATLKQTLADEIGEQEAQIPESPTLGQARRNMRRQLRALGRLAPSENGQVLFDLERCLVLAFRDYLMAEVPELNSGDTANEIKGYIDTKLGDGGRKEALSALAARFVVYQRSLERGAAALERAPAEEALAIESLLQRLQPHAWMFQQVKGLFARS